MFILKYDIVHYECLYNISSSHEIRLNKLHFYPCIIQIKTKRKTLLHAFHVTSWFTISVHNRLNTWQRISFLFRREFYPVPKWKQKQELYFVFVRNIESKRGFEERQSTLERQKPISISKTNRHLTYTPYNLTISLETI